MSSDTESSVWRNSPYHGDRKLVHLAIARIVNEAHQWEFWAGDKYLADLVGCSLKTVERTRTDMINDGILELKGFHSGTGNKLYTFAMPGTPDSLSGLPENGSSDHASPDIQSPPPDILSIPTRHPVPSDPTSSPSAPIPTVNDVRQEENTVGDLKTIALRDQSKVSSPITFADCWEQYPRKMNRVEAQKVFATRLKQGVPVEKLMRATLHYAASVRGKEQEFMMHATTFYGPNQRWQDYEHAPIVEAPGVRQDPMKRGGPSLLQQRAAILASEQARPPSLKGPAT